MATALPTAAGPWLIEHINIPRALQIIVRKRPGAPAPWSDEELPQAVVRARLETALAEAVSCDRLASYKGTMHAHGQAQLKVEAARQRVLELQGQLKSVDPKGATTLKWAIDVQADLNKARTEQADLEAVVQGMGKAVARAKEDFEAEWQQLIDDQLVAVKAELAEERSQAWDAIREAITEQLDVLLHRGECLQVFSYVADNVLGEALAL